MNVGMIVAGDYKGKGITFHGLNLVLGLKTIWKMKDGENCIVINKQNVASYSVIDKTEDINPKKNMYKLEINWSDGKRSLCECNQQIYDEIVKIMF